MDYLPHRYPFLLVDRVIEYEERQKIVGIKNVTINEPFFQGHFPGAPIMPGVLILGIDGPGGWHSSFQDFTGSPAEIGVFHWYRKRSVS